ncbi:hypothetical protein RED65_01240 [Oceanobacter sp. RED65]|uniref:Uncharacterized protein n=1 Tax=Bermanella marisrubri TaxID=207949 RepID=Q1N4T6_9GAMM|nr:hypothetical protein RED65_01240 [Oceanobacter sp. RED65] [Bermanella marisrubri]
MLTNEKASLDRSMFAKIFLLAQAPIALAHFVWRARIHDLSEISKSIGLKCETQTALSK